MNDAFNNNSTVLSWDVMFRTNKHLQMATFFAFFFCSFYFSLFAFRAYLALFKTNIKLKNSDITQLISRYNRKDKYNE